MVSKLTQHLLCQNILKNWGGGGHACACTPPPPPMLIACSTDYYLVTIITDNTDISNTSFVWVLNICQYIPYAYLCHWCVHIGPSWQRKLEIPGWLILRGMTGNQCFGKHQFRFINSLQGLTLKGRQKAVNFVLFLSYVYSIMCNFEPHRFFLKKKS